jgi:anti-sigma-K factor RskA
MIQLATPGLAAGALGSQSSATPVAASPAQQAQATDAIFAALVQPQGGTTTGKTAGSESSAWWLLYGEE